MARPGGALVAAMTKPKTRKDTAKKPKRQPPRKPAITGRQLDWLAAAAILAGFALRWRMAGLAYFVLDEAYHVRLSTPGFPDLWRTMHEPTHPPLLIFLLHWLWPLGTSEYVFRAIPVLCGAIFPWFVYRWMGLVWSRAGGFAALMILTFSPTVIQLSAEVRQYTLGMFCLSVAFYCLERSFQGGEPAGARWMWRYVVSLWFAAVALFPAAFYVGALGLAVVVRWRETGFSVSARRIWLGGQAACALTYVHLYFRQVQPLRASHQKLVADTGSYFRDAFPRPWQTPLEFAWKGFFSQFELLFRSDVLAWTGFALFGVAVLWLGLAWRRAGAARTLAALAVLIAPFVFACAAAFAKLHPFGQSRQTIVLSLSVAAGAGLAADRLSRGRMAAVAAVMTALVPVWYWQASLNPLTHRVLEERRAMREAMALLRREAPAGSAVLASARHHFLLYHYLGDHSWPQARNDGALLIGGYRVFSRDGEWPGLGEVEQTIERLRASSQLDAAETVWVVDTSWPCKLCDAAADRRLRSGLPPGTRSWGRTAAVIPVPAGYKFPPAPVRKRLPPPGSPTRGAAGP